MQVEGILYGHWETGTEGVIWSLQRNPDPDRWSYDDLFPLQERDHLTILHPDGSTEWEGVITFDHEVGYQPFPNNPQSGQQVSLGHYVRGIQQGFDPDAWGTLFLGWELVDRETKVPLRAAPYRGILTRKADIWHVGAPVALLRYRTQTGESGTWAMTYPEFNPNPEEFMRDALRRWAPATMLLDFEVVDYETWQQKQD